jgi:uncharacterized membrane protein
MMELDLLALATNYVNFVLTPVIILSLLTVLNWLMAIIVAWRKGEFEWARIGDVAITDFLKIVSFAIFSAVVAIVQIPEVEGFLGQFADLTPVVALGLAAFVGVGVVGRTLGHLSYFFKGWEPGTRRFGITKE